ncbi:MAG: HAMP domain-containing sensor histidine kinase, partial [Planctomycetota bacterium]
FAQMALEDPRDRKLSRKALRHAMRGAIEASEIATGMLGYARTTDQTPHCDIRQVIHAALRLTHATGSEQGAEVEVSVPDGAFVQMRPLALQQVLVNLILNAKEAFQGSPGKIEISVDGSTWNTSDRLNQSHWKLRVCDNGPGIPEEVQSKLFSPRYTQQSSHAGSTGLGLAICKALIKEADGEIKVRSSAENGTAFTITLPARQDETGSRQRAA